MAKYNVDNAESIGGEVVSSLPDFHVINGHIQLICSYKDFILPKNISEEILQQLQSIRLSISDLKDNTERTDLNMPHDEPCFYGRSLTDSDCQINNITFSVSIDHKIYSTIDQGDVFINISKFNVIVTKNSVEFNNKNGFKIIDKWRKSLDLFTEYLQTKLQPKTSFCTWCT